MKARHLVLAAWRAFLPGALLLSTHGVALAVGITAGGTNTPVPAASATSTQVLYIPQTPKPTPTTQVITIAFTPTPSPAPGAPATAVPTRTFTPQRAATLPPPPSTGAPTVAAASAATPTLAAQATPTLVQDTPAPIVTPLPATSTPAMPSGGVVLNEVLSNPQSVKWDKNGSEPTSQMQWLELYNTTAADVSLSFWFITAGGPAYPTTFGPETTIPAHGYLVFFKRETGLNLAKNPISLMDPNGNVVDSVTSPSLLPDQSYARVPDGTLNWAMDPSPTLGSANVLINPTATPDVQATVSAIETLVAEPLPSPPAFDDDLPDATDLETGKRPLRARKGQPFRPLTIGEIRVLPDDSAVVTTGTVTMPTGRWSAARAYLQEDVGILVHTFGDQPLQLGDSVTIRGRVHHFHGEVEIAAVKGGIQASPGASTPVARDTFPGDVGAGTEALLVQVTGRVSKSEHDYVTFEDVTGSARVFLYSQLGFSSSPLTAGQTVIVTAVVNAADPAAAGSGGSSHRLLPRSTEDILIGGAAAGAEPSGVASRSGSRASSAGGRGPSERQIGPGLAFAGAAPTEFVTPVLTGGRVSASPNQPNGATLMLLNGARNAPPWVWPLVAAVAGLLGGGGIGAGLWWRQRRRLKSSDAHFELRNGSD